MLLGPTNDKIDLREDGPALSDTGLGLRQRVSINTKDADQTKIVFTSEVKPKITLPLTVLASDMVDTGDDASVFATAGMSTPGGYAAKVAETVTERAAKYGPPNACHQLTADLWGKWLTRKLNQTVILTAEDVCMLMVLLKVTRLADGTNDDSLLDAAGYVENVAHLSVKQRNYRS